MLFSVFRLAAPVPPGLMAARYAAIEKHYRVDRGTGVRCLRYFDEKSGIGCHVAWQSFGSENFLPCVETETDIACLAGCPFGYSALSPELKPSSALALEIATELRASPSSIEMMHPPFWLLHVDKAAQTAHVYTDVAGYARTFRLDTRNGFVISNRSIAPFFITLDAPVLSELGWAAEQMNGYIYGELTAFQELKRNAPGASFTITPTTITTERNDTVLRWFSSPPRGTFDGLNRLAAEFQALVREADIDVALTGGRDSRASAAFAYRALGGFTRGRTSYPPELERIIAKQLVSRLPDFQAFQDDDHAVRSDGSTCWRGRPRPITEKADLSSRARAWAYIHEGSGLASALYGNCPMQSMFSPHAAPIYSVAGHGGELAKAYGYRPMQVSGVFAADRKKWLREVEQVPAIERVATHPTTGKKPLHFANEEYWPLLSSYIHGQFAQAQAAGVSGYRFFDYWYLVGRMAGAQTPGYSHSTQVLPFLTPEYIQAGGMDTLERKIDGRLNRDIVDRYMPTWSDVPYFDEIQNSRPRAEVRFFQPQEFLWAGSRADEFFRIIEESAAFDAPYVRGRIIAHYRSVDSSGASLDASNVQAHSLVYRHAVHELARETGERIQTLRSTCIGESMALREHRA